MVLKRHFGGEEDDAFDGSNRESRQRLSVDGDLSEICLHEYVTSLEPFLRRVVREQVDLAIQHFFDPSTRSYFNQVGSSVARAWQLHFLNKLPSTLFTSSKVESEEGEVIKIVLVDADSEEIITSGPLSSVKIEIVAIDGDFVAGEREEWTKEEFDACVIRERDGKRPLLTGDLVITLRNGVAELDNICFTDNSSWIRCRKFRLGARLHGISTEARVREAKSEAFMVKDHRGESYKKHHPPSLVDEVWRLERIAKDGAFHKKLVSAGISTLKDFLRLYNADQSKLRNVLGGGISKKTWDTIIEHATACVLDDKMYLYVGAAERVVLVFNSIWKVIGATFDGQTYQNLDKLNLFQMRLVEDVTQQAYKNLDKWVPFDEQSFKAPQILSASLQAELLSCPDIGQNKSNSLVADQGLLQMQLSSDHATTAALPNTFAVDNGSQLDVSLANYCHSLQAIYPTLTNSFTMKDFCYGSYSEGYSAAPSGSLLESVSIRDIVADDISQHEMSNWQGDQFFLAPSNQSVANVSSNFGFCFSNSRKPKARWCKLRAAIKWGISVRRVVAAKRMARLRYLDY